MTGNPTPASIASGDSGIERFSVGGFEHTEMSDELPGVVEESIFDGLLVLGERRRRHWTPSVR